jgi:hypothetical protein
MGTFGKATKTGLFTLVLAALLCSAGASGQTQATMSTNAPQPKEDSSQDGWHFAVTPYIWFSGVHGSTGILGQEASVHASFGDIFNYLNIGAMGVFEARYNRVVIPIDFMWMRLSDERGLPINESADYLKTKMNQTMLTPKIGYEIVDGKKIKVIGVIGARYWHVGLTLNPYLEGTQIASFSDSANWADAVAGGRITAALAPKVNLIIGGDAGGASARSDYQVFGALGYQLSRKWELLAGYRYLSVNYRPYGKAQFVYDVNMPGLVLGATYNIK